MNVAIVIRTLSLAGAERQAMLLATGLRQRGHRVTLILLRDDDGLGKAVADAGVDVQCLGGDGLRDAPRTVARLGRLLARGRYDAVYGYMDGPNVLVSTIGHVARRATLATGLRASGVAAGELSPLSSVLYRLEPYISRGSQLVIVNSYAGLQDALRRRFHADRLRVVANGVDSDHFTRDLHAGLRVRREIGVPDGRCLIGRFGRLHPVKGYEDLLEALVLVERWGVPFHAVFVGAGETGPSLRQRTEELGLRDHVTWLEPRLDLRPIYSALDLFVSSSRHGEGLPNVVAEAMACEVPCVVTDVGDSSVLVGDTGTVVPPGQPDLLAQAIRRWIDLPDRLRTGARARQRVIERYSVSSMVTATETLLLGRSS
jgi:glycosyltransferase involved in cell wall biosynthesis